MSITEPAICLRRSDYSETSLILRLFTRDHGQVSVMAKGVKRPKSRFGGSIDLLAVGQAVFTLPRAHSVSTLGTLTEWTLLAYHPRLRSELLRHATATLAGELLSRLTEELDPHPASFDAMLGLLDALQDGQPPLRRLVEFARVLLADAGLSPNLSACVDCGRPLGPPAGPVTFSGSRGGVFCGQCRPRPGESSVQVSRHLHRFFAAEQSPDGKMALEITRWLVYYVQHQIGQPLQSAATLERAISAALAALTEGKKP